MKRLVFWMVILSTVANLTAQKENPLLIKVNPAKLTPIKNYAFQWLDSNGEEFFKMSDSIWRFAEIAMEEFQSSELLSSYLEKKDLK